MLPPVISCATPASRSLYLLVSLVLQQSGVLVTAVYYRVWVLLHLVVLVCKVEYLAWTLPAIP